MFTELVRTETEDGVALDGAYFESSVPAATTAVLILHGVGGNFYSSRLLRALADALRPSMHVLRANTRGHDGFFQAATGRLGAAYEVVDDCRWDVAAWLRWLRERGARHLVVAGHSLGAIKAVYSQAHLPHPRTRAIVAISAPRLSPAAFEAGSRRDEYLAVLEEARRHVDAGQPERLIESCFPYPLLITAAGYVDKYAADRYNIMTMAGQLPCRSLFAYGQQELQQGGAPFDGVLPELQSLPTLHPLDTCVVPDADHFYRQKEQQLANIVAQWLNSAAAT